MSFDRPDDLVLDNVTTMTTIPATDMAVAYDVPSNTATFTFPTYQFGALPDGKYHARLVAAGITDAGGTPMAADFTSDFFFLMGDANRDMRVNLQDFNRLASNFGQFPRDFSQADFNYDGTVNLQDFNLLAGEKIVGQLANGRDDNAAVCRLPVGSPVQAGDIQFGQCAIGDLCVSFKDSQTRCLDQHAARGEQFGRVAHDVAQIVR